MNAQCDVGGPETVTTLTSGLCPGIAQDGTANRKAWLNKTCGNLVLLAM